MMLDRLTPRSKWLTLIVLVYCLLLFPLFGVACFSPFVSDSLNISIARKHATVLLPYGTEDSLYSIECESDSFETTFYTNVNVEASVTCPRVSETNSFSQHVNEALRKEACELHDIFVQEMSVPEEDNYVISGFDDYPVTLLIPYAELTSIANFDRPWPVWDPYVL